MLKGKDGLVTAEVLDVVFALVFSNKIPPKHLCPEVEFKEKY